MCRSHSYAPGTSGAKYPSLGIRVPLRNSGATSCLYVTVCLIPSYPPSHCFCHILCPTHSAFQRHGDHAAFSEMGPVPSALVPCITSSSTELCPTAHSALSTLPSRHMWFHLLPRQDPFPEHWTESTPSFPCFTLVASVVMLL